MRVHQLDELFGVDKDAVKALLETIGHSTNAVNGVEDKAMLALQEEFGGPAKPYVGKIVIDGRGGYMKVVDFERDGTPILAAAEIQFDDDEVITVEGHVDQDGVAVADDPQPLPPFSDELKEHPGTGVPNEGIELEPGQEHELVSGSAPEPPKQTQPLKTPATAEEEEESDMTMDIVDISNGQKTGEVAVDKRYARQVKNWLGSRRKIASYRVDDKRNRFVAVSYPDGAKQVFRPE